MKKNVKKTTRKNTVKTAPEKDTGTVDSTLIRQISGVCFAVLGVFLMITLIFDITGSLGKFISLVLKGMLGACSYAIPVLMIYFTVWMFTGGTKNEFRIKLWSSVVFLISLTIILDLFSPSALPGFDGLPNFISELFRRGNDTLSSGGVIGGILYAPLLKLLDKVGTGIIVGLITLISFMLFTGITFAQVFRVFSLSKIKKSAVTVGEKISGMATSATEKHKTSIIDIPVDDMEKIRPLPTANKVEESLKITNFKSPGEDEYDDEKEIDPVKSEITAAEVTASTAKVKSEIDSFNHKNTSTKYKTPPISILAQNKSVNQSDVSQELRQNSKKLLDALNSFGVEASVVAASRGPAVTRYEVLPGTGVKISKIANLSDDIALNLSAIGVRIEAPIPGKSAIGIEIPNRKVDSVFIRDLITTKEFKEASSELTVALGKDIAGNSITADIAKMPHLLIAGSTGSGKSVCINSLIVSLIYKSDPEKVKLLMIDPKVVELSVYNGIPHLLIPVVTDPRKASGALNWAVSEMLQRYKMFAEHNVRDIAGYNEAASFNSEIEYMPQIVLIIDELADLMMVAPNEVEDAICRLAQMARAAGMHLVIATQRPSVDVITGTIKANIPSRIAFAVSSQINSRIILDMSGAEKLLGKGDMLFNPIGLSKPIRVQGCFVSDKEVEAITDYIKRDEAQYDEHILDHIENQSNEVKNEKEAETYSDKDEFYESAVEVILDAGLCSVSLLQRKLKLGYARAARIVDQMEENGIVGPYEGSKPRSVLITRNQWFESKMVNAE